MMHPASAPEASEMSREAASCSSSMTKALCRACAAEAAISGLTTDEPNLVQVPDPLRTRRTPSSESNPVQVCFDIVSNGDPLPNQSSAGRGPLEAGSSDFVEQNI